MKTFTLILFAFILTLNCISQPRNVTLKITGGIDDQYLKGRIEHYTTHLLTAMNTAYVNRQTELVVDDKTISREALAILNDHWREMQFYCAVPAINENLLTASNSFQIRNIPIALRDDTQTAVISYNKEGRIDDFYFGLDIHHYQNIMLPGSVVDKTRREIILNFIENFRTAYIRKDIKFIEKVFSEHALIITGRVIQQQDINTDYIKRGLSARQIEYQVHTKAEYVDRLRRVFSNINYLVLEFNNIEVNIHRKFPSFYGVLLEQHWASPHYQDTGYLFLVIQFRENEHPLIWVRTWQDASEVSSEDIFGFHNFRIREGAIH